MHPRLAGYASQARWVCILGSLGMHPRLVGYASQARWVCDPGSLGMRPRLAGYATQARWVCDPGSLGMRPKLVGVHTQTRQDRTPGSVHSQPLSYWGHTFVVSYWGHTFVLLSHARHPTRRRVFVLRDSASGWFRSYWGHTFVLLSHAPTEDRRCDPNAPNLKSSQRVAVRCRRQQVQYGCSKLRYRNTPRSPAEGPTPIGRATPGTIWRPES